MKPKTSDGRKLVDAYLKRLPPSQRETLDVVRDRLRTILPDAVEAMKYVADM